MHRHRAKTIRSLAAAAFCAATVFAGAFAALAQGDPTGLDATANQAGLKTGAIATPEKIIGGIISGLLGFVGIIFLLIVIYAGLLWMTAAGNEEKVKKAVKLITGATIGIIIVFAAYAITRFVLTSVVGSTSGPGTGNPSDAGSQSPNSIPN